MPTWRSSTRVRPARRNSWRCGAAVEWARFASRMGTPISAIPQSNDATAGLPHTMQACRRYCLLKPSLPRRVHFVHLKLHDAGGAAQRREFQGAVVGDRLHTLGQGHAAVVAEDLDRAAVEQQAQADLAARRG